MAASEKHDDFENPSTYPKGGAYGQLLWWHLFVWGTRPEGDTQTSLPEWDLKKFAHAVHDGEGLDDETPVDNLNNWIYGVHKPNFKKRRERIEWLLFEDKVKFQKWKSDLRESLKRPKEWDFEGFKAEISDITISKLAVFVPFLHHQFHKSRAEPSSLIELLRTDVRATSMVGREAELGMLRDWLAAPQDIAVKCIVGGAGAGKTRLAIEACEAAEAAGWFATFLPSSDLRAVHERRDLANWALTQPTLIVIDDAAMSVSTLKQWFDELAPLRNRPGHALRILLLERFADRDSGWWANLTRPSSNARASSADLIGSEAPYVLSPLDTTCDCRALLAEVMAKAAPLFDPPRKPITPPLAGESPSFDQRLSDNTLDTEPLYLMMAGICAVETDVSSALTMNRLNLAQRIAGFEEERMQAFATARGFTDQGSLLKHIAACITLQNGCEPFELLSLVKEERQTLSVALPFDDEKVAEILCDYLPVAAKVEPVRPDLVGESFCLSVIRGGQFRSKNTQRDMVMRCWDRDPSGTIETLIRCACDLSGGDTNHVSISYLFSIVESEGDFNFLRLVIDSIPSEFSFFSELLTQTSSKIVKLLKPIDATSDGFNFDLASALHGLSVHLSAQCQHEKAFSVAEDALTLWRRFAVAQPDDAAPNLAMVLLTFANCLRNLGRPEEALAAMEESLITVRKMVARPNYLASSLGIFASCLNDLNRHEEAFLAADEALVIWRQLAVGRDSVFKNELAIALNNAVIYLDALGRYEEALAVAEEALDLNRQFAIAHPGVSIDGLAVALGTLANILGILGLSERAFVAAEESLALSRQLATSQPDVFLSQLANALNAFANCLNALDRRKEALVAAEEAVRIYRQLVAVQPDAFMSDLALVLNNVAIDLGALGRNEEALIAIEEALMIRRQLSIVIPEAYTSKLAKTLNIFVMSLDALGRYEEAFVAAEEALGFWRALAAARPDAFLPDLAFALRNFAKCLDNLGRCEDAFVAVNESLLLHRQLAKLYPDVFALNIISVSELSKNISEKISK